MNRLPPRFVPDLLHVIIEENHEMRLSCNFIGSKTKAKTELYEEAEEFMETLMDVIHDYESLHCVCVDFTMHG